MVKEIATKENNHILNYMEEDFEDKLQSKVKELSPTCCFNAIGNNVTAKILKALPDNGIIYQYGNISLQNLGDFNSEEFLFRNKQLRGFWMSNFVSILEEEEKSVIYGEVARELRKGRESIFYTDIQAEFTFEQLKVAQKTYLKNMTKGKVLLIPQYVYIYNVYICCVYNVYI